MRQILFIFLTLFVMSAFSASKGKPLPGDSAFHFSAVVQGKDQIRLQWQIEKGYFLYKNSIKVRSAHPDAVTIGPYVLPQGSKRHDALHGTYQVYSDFLSFNVPLLNTDQKRVNVIVNYQGCSAKGFCYTPFQKEVHVDRASTKPLEIVNGVLGNGVMTTDLPLSKQDYATQLFSTQNVFLIVLSFFGMGLLLALTPCVLPMVPILSSIIFGHKHLTTLKGFSLSLVYVIGMSLTYAVMGVVVASLGNNFQAVFQKPFVIALLSLLFAFLALSLFGLYDIELPSRVKTQLTSLSHHQKQGSYVGVFMMGVLSSLIVSPCVSAPLVGALAYIANTGDRWLGGFALWALGLGMGFPLLLVGASAGKVLPKTGPWMESIKRCLGILMLGMAIWLLSRIIPGPLSLLLWGVLLVGSAYFVARFFEQGTFQRMISKMLAALMATYGLILLIGGFLGNADPLKPWGTWNKQTYRFVREEPVSFTVVNTMDALDAILKSSKKPILLDFYADWCVSCVLMDRNVLSNVRVKEALSGIGLIRIDVTHDTLFDEEVMKRFHIVGPPAFLFFNANGTELKSERIVEETDVDTFLNHLKSIQLRE